MSPTRRRLIAGSIGAAAVTSMAAAGSSASPDSELIALCRRFSDLELLKNSHFAHGSNPIDDDDERDIVFEPIGEEMRGLLNRIVELKATTVAGIRARTDMIITYNVGCLEHPSDFDDFMLHALLVDLRAMFDGGAL